MLSDKGLKLCWYVCVCVCWCVSPRVSTDSVRPSKGHSDTDATLGRPLLLPKTLFCSVRACVRYAQNTVSVSASLCLQQPDVPVCGPGPLSITVPNAELLSSRFSLFWQSKTQTGSPRRAKREIIIPFSDSHPMKHASHPAKARGCLSKGYRSPLFVYATKASVFPDVSFSWFVSRPFCSGGFSALFWPPG